MADGPEIQQASTQPAPAGAAPGTPVEGAAPGQSGTKMVPLAAVEGEQENTRRAREANTRMKTLLELKGTRVDDEGNIIDDTPVAYQNVPAAGQPAPSQAQYPPQIVRYAESLGVEPSVIWDSQMASINTVAGPVVAWMVALEKKSLKTTEPDFDVISADIDRFIAPAAAMGGKPEEIVARAVRMAKVENLDKIVARKMDREKEGKIVGRFGEPAAGGNQVPSAEPFSDAAKELMRQQGYTPEQIATAEAGKREVSRRGR